MQSLRGMVEMLESEPLFGRHIVAALRERDTLVCLADKSELRSAHGLFVSDTGALLLNDGKSPAERFVALIHEGRHAQLDAHGVIRSVNTTVGEETKLSFAMEADAQAVAVRVAWELKKQGQPAAWIVLRNTTHYSDVAQSFEDDILAGHDEDTATKNAFKQWYTSEWRLATHARLLKNYREATADMRAALPFQESLGDEPFQFFCRPLPGSDLEATQAPCLKAAEHGIAIMNWSRQASLAEGKLDSWGMQSDKPAPPLLEEKPKSTAPALKAWR